MPRTVQEIIDQATARYNPNRQSTGQLLREDVAEFLAQLPQDADKKAELSKLLVNFAFLTIEDRNRILDNIQSYDNYGR